MYIAPAPAPRRSEPKPIAAVAAGPTTLVSLGDGDTIRVSTAHGQKVTIRMACIDAPDVGPQGGVPPSGVNPWAQHRRSRC